MPKGFEPAYALMRIYRDEIKELRSDDDLEMFRLGGAQVIRIYWTPDEVDSEVARLNELNKAKGAFYYCLHTRVQCRPS